MQATYIARNYEQHRLKIALQHLSKMFPSGIISCSTMLSGLLELLLTRCCRYKVSSRPARAGVKRRLDAVETAH